MSSAALNPPAAAATARAYRSRRPSTFIVYRWELRKLLAQVRTYLGLGLLTLWAMEWIDIRIRAGFLDQPRLGLRAGERDAVGVAGLV